MSGDGLTLMGVLVPIIHGLGILSAVHAVLYTRTPQGAIGWAMSLFVFPYVVIPLYWIFGPRKFHSYIRKIHRARERHQERIRVQLAELEAARAELENTGRADFRQLLESLTGLSITRGNQASLLVDGRETFDAYFEAIEAAQTYILVQFYIVRDDEIGRELKERLIRKAAQGVRICFLADMIGSFYLPTSYRKELIDAGVHFYEFRTGRRLRNRLQINFRNHRKITICDGRIGFTGGLNVGDEYLGKHPVLRPWRDTHLRVEGPIVQQLQIAFAKDWYWATEEMLNLNWSPAPSADPGMLGMAVASGPEDDIDTCLMMVLGLIQEAEERVWIATPYFVPDEAIAAALHCAALQGVDVRILLPKIPDHLIAQFAAWAYMPEIIASGAKVYMYPGFMHQKAILVDNDLAAIGTVNMDNRSFRLNFEDTALFFDRDFAAATESMLMRDFESSEELREPDLQKRPIYFQAASGICRLFAPIL